MLRDGELMQLLDDCTQPFRQHHQSWAFNVDFFSTGIPILLLFAPFVATQLFRDPTVPRQRYIARPTWLLVVAAATWFMSVQLPNIPLWPQHTESTTMHMLGGMVIAPALLKYFTLAYRIERQHLWWRRFCTLFAFTSAFSVANELFEFVATSTGVSAVDGTDVWYDLAATTLGTLVFFIGSEIWDALKRRASNDTTYRNIANMT